MLGLYICLSLSVPSTTLQPIILLSSFTKCLITSQCRAKCDVVWVQVHFISQFLFKWMQMHQHVLLQVMFCTYTVHTLYLTLNPNSKVWFKYIKSNIGELTFRLYVTVHTPHTKLLLHKRSRQDISKSSVLYDWHPQAGGISTLDPLSLITIWTVTCFSR